MLHIFPMSLHAQDFSWHFISPSWHPTLYPSRGQDKYDPQFDLCGHHFSQSVVNKQTNKPTSIHNNQCRHTINICWPKQWKEEITTPPREPTLPRELLPTMKRSPLQELPFFLQSISWILFLYSRSDRAVSQQRTVSITASNLPTLVHKNLFLLLVVAKV